MAAGDIWVSFVLNNSSLTVGTEIDRDEPAWKAIARGDVPDEGDFPIRLYDTYIGETFTQKVPELFQGGGGVKISPQLAEIFRKFNLGPSWIYPAQLYLHDRKTPVDHALSIFAGWKKLELLVPDQSTGLRGMEFRARRPNPPPPDVWGVPIDPKDGDIAITARDLDGLDIWYDKSLRGSLFFSDPLKRALCDGGYARLFNFYQTNVIPVH